MSSATVEARARKKAERKLEKQRQAAQHDLPRSMRPSAAVKTLTVVLLVLVLIYFLFPIYWAIIASTKTPIIKNIEILNKLMKAKNTMMI